jgi:tricarballylate dehydrogenase
MHPAPTATLADTYDEAEFWSDILRVTNGDTSPELARLMINNSSGLLQWLVDQGVYFQPSLSGTLSLERTNAFFLGGGCALMNTLYRVAESAGVEVFYDAEVTDLQIEAGSFVSADVAVAGNTQRISASALIAASGGFQANLAWLQHAWGPAAENFIVRGTPYNDGKLLRLLTDKGIHTIGDPAQCHAIAVDARAPKFDGGIVSRLDCVPLSIVVNTTARRFYDEGEDFWPRRYAIWGRLIAQQPDGIAFSIYDAKVAEAFMPTAYPPFKAGSIEALAGALDLPDGQLVAEVEAYNRSVVPGSFDAQSLDDCHTEQLPISKSHWAQTIDEPPFYGYPLRTGITFTYLGVKVDATARVIAQDGDSSPNIFAAGEIMAGNILGQGYCAGTGMTIGGVFGRIAGDQAACLR